MNLLQKIEHKKKQQQKEIKKRKALIATSGIAAGTIIGTITGVLVAPKSGKETREDVKEKGNDIKEKLNENIVETKDKLKQSKLQIKEYLKNKKNKSTSEENEEIITITGSVENDETTIIDNMEEETSEKE